MLPVTAFAQDRQDFIDHRVRVCDAQPGSQAMPDFTQSDCHSALFYEVDPQGQMLWVEFVFTARPALLEKDKPLGLFLSAKASSEAFLNAVPIGSNGVPGVSHLSEDPGDMDAVFFVPEGVLKTGENRLVMRMSSMNGEITLNSPIHNLVLAPYRDPRQPGPATWFALVVFGLFLAASLFFAMRSVRGQNRQLSAIITALSLAAALQLAAEATRDILPYPYPLHDLRLSLILTFAIGLGLSAFAYVLLVLFGPHPRARALALGALLVAAIAISVLATGFDLKTLYVLAATCAASAMAGLVAYWRGNPKGGWFALAGFVLIALIFWLRGFFLDTVLYLIIAIGLLWLLIQPARKPAAGEPSQSDAKPPKRIELISNGKVEFVNIDDVVRFGGAGDYVEVFLKSGRSALYSASLAGIERELSDGFVRVHRSHIVNMSCVKSLVRQSAGTGELQMSDGAVVPVSRRNMASVRSLLTAG